VNAILRPEPAPTRVPPSAIGAEQSVLGGLMLDPTALGKIDLAESDFYRRDHQLIFRAILELDADGKPYDAVTLGDWFEAQGKAGLVQGGAYLVGLVSDTPSAASIRAYADMVRQRAVLRRMIEVCTDGLNAGYNPDGRDAPEILDETIRALMSLCKTEARHEYTLQQAARLAWEDAQDAWQNRGSLRGVTTGYTRMDKRLGGWHKGDLVLIGARPSMGKTALMVNLALNAATAGHHVGMISGEQSVLQIGQRSIAAESKVAAERMRNGCFEDEDWPKLDQAMRRLLERKVRIYDRAGPTLDDIARVARRWKQEHGISVLFVDYLQRIKFKGAESRIDEVSEVSRGLKTLARDLEIPVVALAQVKAAVDTRHGDKRPSLGDIANSDEATREADLIGFLYRDEVYDEESHDKGIAELNFEKNRHGPTGRFRLRFDGETMRFLDLAEGWGE
jgi:replicative DNA helicase